MEIYDSNLMSRILKKLEQRKINKENFDEYINSKFSNKKQLNEKQPKIKYKEISIESYYVINDINNDSISTRKQLYDSFTYIDSEKYNTIVEEFSTKKWDIFLSHAYKDRLITYGLYLLLTEDLGLTVYIDWLIDPYLGKTRNSVTKKNIRLLQLRLKQSRSLSLFQTNNFTSSRWIAWEIGYYDALTSKIFVIPNNSKKVKSKTSRFYSFLIAYYYGVVESKEIKIYNRLIKKSKMSFIKWIA